MKYIKDYIAMLREYYPVFRKASFAEVTERHGYTLYYQPPVDMGKVLLTVCKSCQSNTQWHLMKHTRWAIILIPAYPVRSDYYLRCAACEQDIKISKGESVQARRIIRSMARQDKVLSAKKQKDIDALLVYFKQRIGTMKREHINIDVHAPWTEQNDKIVAAIKLTMSRPEEAIDRIHQICLEPVNINALDENKNTVLNIARYEKTTRLVQDVLLDYGAVYLTHKVKSTHFQ